MSPKPVVPALPSRRRRARVRTAAAVVAGTAAAFMFSIPSHADNPGGTQLGNWFVKSGTTLSPTPLSDGSYGYQVTNVGSSPVTAVLNDKVNSFTTVAGASYIVDEWIRTPDAPGMSVGLREMEYRGSTKLGQAQTGVWLRGTGWHHVVTSYVAKSTGASIDINSLAWSLPAGRSFVVAHIVRSALGAGSGSGTVTDPGPTPSPTPSTPVPTTTVPTTTVPTTDVPTTSAPPTTAVPTSTVPTTDTPTTAVPTTDTPTTAVPTTPAPTTPAPTTTAPTTSTPAPSPTTTTPDGSGGVPPGYHMVWSDEFNAGSLDPSNWSALNYSTYGDGNGEVACLMNRPQNLSETNGVLHITAQRESTPITCGSHDSRFPNGRSYTSAMINTAGKRAFKYGYFEIRAKLPTQQLGSKGLWPAFWLRPANGSLGELDVLEAIGSETQSSELNTAHQTIWYDYNGTYPKQTNNATLAPTADGYHTFGILWAPGLLQWIVDGKVTYTRTSATTPWLDSAFNQPFYFRLNMAIGGSWPGLPTANTNLPASYDIDYIRVYQQ